MRVLQLGNVGNIAFNYAKYLRKAGVECDLLVPESVAKNDIAWEHEEYDWIKTWKHTNPVKTLVTLRKITKEYDIIHAHGGMSLYAQFLGKPFIAHSMGSDLRIVAMKNTPGGILLRRAFKNCNKFFFCQPDQLGLIERLKLNAMFVFQIIDTEKYRPGKATSNKKLTLFYPTRHSWKTKANDRFFKACARFLKTYPNAKLVTLYWDDYKDMSKALVKELGIEDKVTFMDPLQKKDMIRMYHEADIIVDEFNIGSFGLIALEGMACGKPVLRYIDEELHSKFYGEPAPVANAQTEDEIVARLKELANKAHRQELGKKARNFVLKYHDWKFVTNTLINQYQQMV